MAFLAQFLGLKAGSVRVCSHQCDILDQALDNVDVFLQEIKRHYNCQVPVWKEIDIVTRYTARLLKSCRNAKNWVVSSLLFEERREDFQVIHAELYGCIELVSVQVFHLVSTVQDKSLVHKAYTLCMGKKHTVEDLEKAAASDRAELLNRIDQQMKKSPKQEIEQVLLKLKDLLEVGGRVFINHEKIILKGHIARGSSGSVYKARWLGHPFAVKVFETGDTTFPKELGVLSRLKHPNVLHIAGHSYDPHKEKHLLLMEKMDMDLATFLKTKKTRLNTSTLLSITLQIAAGMAWLHSHKIIHRDLKPQNVLVACQGDYVVVRVADFGLARTGFITSLLSGATSRRGTLNYMAPEVWTSENYTKKADVYSFGILCCQVVASLVPFQNKLVNKQGQRPELPDTILSDVVSECCKQNPRERPEFSEICDKLKMVKGTYSTGLHEFAMARQNFLDFLPFGIESRPVEH